MRYITRYFDSLAASMFKTDDQGRTLFFPAGIWSKGRVIGDEASAQRLRDRVRKAYMAMFMIGIPLLVTAFQLIPGAGLLTYVGLGVVFGLIFNLYIFSLSRGLERTDVHMTLREAQNAQAFAIGKGWLITLAITSGVLATGGAVMAFAASGAERWQGALGFVFFAACLAVFLMQLRKLRASREVT
ncbi:MAG: hypothetical protein R3D68_17785 [Hyphomicrobiaceae bacterium]